MYSIYPNFASFVRRRTSPKDREMKLIETSCSCILSILILLASWDWGPPCLCRHRENMGALQKLSVSLVLCIYSCMASWHCVSHIDWDLCDEGKLCSNDSHQLSLGVMSTLAPRQTVSKMQHKHSSLSINPLIFSRPSADDQLDSRVLLRRKWWSIQYLLADVLIPKCSSRSSPWLGIRGEVLTLLDSCSSINIMSCVTTLQQYTVTHYR